MDSVLLARMQFGMTIGFHFLFPPISIGLAWFLVWLERRAWKIGDADSVAFNRFFGKLFAILYIVGLASGIVMTLQFGTNWGRFATFANGIFGPILVIEVLFAFFLESIFFGIWMFGRGRISPALSFWSIFLVAFGATVSAFWIVAADSWMQTPAGYAIVGGRAVLTDFWQAVLNHSSVSRFLHVMMSAASITGFFIAGMSAYLVLSKKGLAFARKTLAVGVVLGILASLGSIGTGVSEAVRLGSQQVEKVAVFRGIEDGKAVTAALPAASTAAPSSSTNAADPDDKKDADATAAASAPAAGAELPPVELTRGAFRVMMGIGVLALVFMLVVLVFLVLKRLPETPFLLRCLMWAIPFPIIATELGWVAAEVGRQPWIVYKLMYTIDAVSVSVSGGMIVFSLILIGLVYVLFLGITLGMIVHEAKSSFGGNSAEAGGSR
jgi:cytochrome bd ubiquinol oxidase subunit I